MHFWAGRQCSEVPRVQLPNSGGEPCSIRAWRTPGVQAREGDISGSCFLLQIFKHFDQTTVLRWPVLFSSSPVRTIGWLSLGELPPLPRAFLAWLTPSRWSGIIIKDTFANLDQVADERWNHLDFIWGREAPTVLFPQILEVGFSFHLIQNWPGMVYC